MMDRTTGTPAQPVSAKPNSATRRHFSAMGIASGLTGSAGMAATAQAAKDAASNANCVLDRR